MQRSRSLMCKCLHEFGPNSDACDVVFQSLMGCMVLVYSLVTNLLLFHKPLHKVFDDVEYPATGCDDSAGSLGSDLHCVSQQTPKLILELAGRSAV